MTEQTNPKYNQSEEPWDRTEKYRKAAEKFKTSGPFGVTAEDHKIVGSTPPPELVENPGKTLADIMSDAEIIEFLKRGQEALKEIRRHQEDNAIPPGSSQIAEKMLERTVHYLAAIGRLPKEFASPENTP